MIDVWYGEKQKFGYPCLSQRWVNVLGRITGRQGIVRSRYSLNGSGFAELSLGPDNRRLLKAGDFNIDLGMNDLNEGINDVCIQAEDQSGEYSEKHVFLDYSAGSQLPLPLDIDWSKVSHILQAAQIVDGKWGLTEGGIRVEEPGYDRLVAIGGMFWRDYEVTVPVTIHSIDESIIGVPPSYHPAVGLVLRFLGHAAWDTSRPRWGYAPVGAIAWYSYIAELKRYRRTFMGGPDLDVAFFGTDPSDRQFLLGIRHIFKARVESHRDKTSRYYLKIWKDDEEEPQGWDISADGVVGELTHGSVLLIAHHCDATFGNVKVRPIG